MNSFVTVRAIPTSMVAIGVSNVDPILAFNDNRSWPSTASLLKEVFGGTADSRPR